ncbi:MAG TPA: prepilin-type N-terminal cleavage/methylation domain-containing protein [Nostocaceae cyanobacterium]|nr:prepilin-type N-terminal cleavage/methylation domain-containing protein [Nostocaceae cyanobacterium]
MKSNNLTKGLRTYFQQRSHILKGQSEQGFTILESIMAIVIISIIVVAVTPPILLVVATRVQNQKAEQARQLAQREVDKVRTLIERGNYANTVLPVSASTTDDAEDIAAPTTFLTTPCSSTPAAYTSACSVDIYDDPNDSSDDNQPEYYIQVFRTKQKTYGSANQVVAFQMGVRVYSAAARGQTGLETTQASLKFTNEQGSQRKYPLAVMYTNVVRSDIKDSLTFFN